MTSQSLVPNGSRNDNLIIAVPARVLAPSVGIGIFYAEFRWL